MPESHVSPSNSRILQPTVSGVEPRRIDTAHPIRGRENVSSEHAKSSGPDALDSEGDLLEQQPLQLHAEQLAEKLQDRQRQLDRREAQLNAQLAKAEHDLRISRLWVQEREAELGEKAELLERRCKELEQRTASFSAAEIASQHDIEQLQTQLAAANQEVEQREARAVEFQKRIAEQQTWLREAAQKLDSAKQQIAAENQLACGELESARNRLEEEERQILQQAETQRALQQQIRDQLDFERRQLAEAQHDLAERRTRLEKRSETLDQRQQVVEQMYDEAQGIHRAALETRLIGEQIWSRLGSAAESYDVDKTVATLRAQLAENFRLAEQSSIEREHQLQEIATRLAAKDEQLRKKRDELQLWLGRRRQEIEEQAARVVARERELDRCNRSHAAECAQWQDERQRLLETIRQLDNGVTIKSPNGQ